MGFTHQQRQIRDRTIDALPNEPGAITDPIIALNYLIERLEERIVRLEGLMSRVTALEAELRSVPSLVAELASRVTAPEASPVTHDTTQRHAHAERQRRYRERKKHGAADSER